MTTCSRIANKREKLSVGHPMAVESPDPGLADSGKDSPILMEDSGKISTLHDDSMPTQLAEQDGKHTATVTSTRISCR